MNKYWVATVKSQADLYSSLQWLNTDIYQPGVCHPLVISTGDLLEMMSLREMGPQLKLPIAERRRLR